jgi:YHS domain-containing protein
MKMRLFGMALAAACIAGLVVNAADEKKFAAKCLVAGKPDAKEDKFSEYKGAKVYFCCDNCKGKFDKDPKAFATKANAQLVSTKQAKQVKCPISGQPVDEAQTAEVNGVKVAFCCGNCKGKVAKAEGDAKTELVFSEDAFKKGFEVPKKK